MNRTVSLTLTADDYVAANRLHFLNGLRSRNALAIFVMMAVAYLVWTAIAYFDQWEALRVVALNVFFATVVILTIANYFLFVPIVTRRAYRNHKLLHRPYTFSWSETGLTVTSSSGQSQVAWSDYLKWYENAQIFILYQAPRLFNMLPKRALTPEQIADVRQCASRIGE
jgi:YcxB-like protein